MLKKHLVSLIKTLRDKIFTQFLLLRSEKYLLVFCLLHSRLINQNKLFLSVIYIKLDVAIKFFVSLKAKLIFKKASM